MTVYEMAKQLELTPIAVPEGDRNCAGVYIGDLPSCEETHRNSHSGVEWDGK